MSTLEDSYHAESRTFRCAECGVCDTERPAPENRGTEARLPEGWAMYSKLGVLCADCVFSEAVANTGEPW